MISQKQDWLIYGFLSDGNDAGLRILEGTSQNINQAIMEISQDLISQIDALIRRDPARRGLIGSEPEYGPLCVGHLAAAAAHLAEFGTHVAIATGFYVPHAEPPAAETDGPLGALMLADVLYENGVDTTVITDAYCEDVLVAAAAAVGFPADRVLVFQHGSSNWLKEFFESGPGRNLTHLIAIERVGPSHTTESLGRQTRTTAAPLGEFHSRVPAESHGRCHNMRGVIIDEYTADMHRLFEVLAEYRPEAKSIGIGDGANEIGMGVVLWEELDRRLASPKSGQIPCRVATDWNIVAGTSNWGGYALAAATMLLRHQTEILRDWDVDRQLRVLEHIVEHGPAVDGVTGRQQATVDGLPFLTYIQPWQGIRRLLQIDD